MTNKTKADTLFHVGDEAGFADFISEYSGFVFAIVKNKLYGTCSDGDIEEITSDVFLEFYNKRDSFDESRGTVKSFLASIAKHRAIDHFRRVKSEISTISADDEENGVTDIPDEYDIEEQSISAEESKRLSDAVVSLGEPDGTILFRKYWLGESSQEIARVTGLSQNAVIKRAGRALAKLKSILGGEF